MEVNKMSENVSLSSEVIVPISGRSIKVKKLGLIKYAELTEKLQGSISTIVELIQLADNNLSSNPSPEEKKEFLTQALTRLLKKNVEQIITLLDTCVPDLGYDFICQEVGLDDALALVEAILKVNNINKVVEDVKNLWGVLTKKTN